MVATGAVAVKAPRADAKWHPIAKRWYGSLAKSGQAEFYQPSDWMTAYVVAESISRELSPQPIVGKDGAVVMVTFPPKAAAVTAWLKAMGGLLVTAGDRQKARLELVPPDAESGEDADVSELAEYRRRLEQDSSRGPA